MADYDRGVKYLLDFEESICYICCKILWLSDKKLDLKKWIDELATELSDKKLDLMYWIYVVATDSQRMAFERRLETSALSDAKIIGKFEPHTIKRVLERINDYG